MKTVILLLISLPGLLIGQSKISFSNAKPINERPYSEVKGDYLLFSEDTPGTLYHKNNGVVGTITLNYNRQDDLLVAIENGQQYVDLKKGEYPKAVWTDLGSAPKELKFLDSLVLLVYPHPKVPNKYGILLYRDDEKTAIYHYQTDISTTVERPPGQIIERKKFVPEERIYLITDDGVTAFELKKKEVASALSSYGDINKWCKSNKLKSTTPEGVTSFLAAH